MTSTILRRLIPTLGTAYGLQLLGAAIFVPLQTEKFYDLGGSLGYISTAFASLYAPYLRERFWVGNRLAKFPSLTSHAPRQLLLTGAVMIWAGRLGSFLVQRVLREGKDSRFDEIKKQPLSFTFMWIGQATWIAVVGLPIWLANALPASAHPALGVRDFAGISLAIISLAIEVIADRQKTIWRRDKSAKKHDEKFISSGLWSISRHPNYVGEVGIWTGIWLLASRAMQSSLLPQGAVIATAISPIFTYLLLTKASGVPPLEKSADEKFKDDPKWQEYKRHVPIFFPWGAKGDFKDS
ncbi:hypothetical protein FRC03_008479 [Tulasnella sp. 419]|nr:hypothetical protein FRC03_008479 [Tulasnella sp. 419]